MLFFMVGRGLVVFSSTSPALKILHKKVGSKNRKAPTQTILESRYQVCRPFLSEQRRFLPNPYSFVLSFHWSLILSFGNEEKPVRHRYANTITCIHPWQRVSPNFNSRLELEKPDKLCALIGDMNLKPLLLCLLKMQYRWTR